MASGPQYPPSSPGLVFRATGEGFSEGIFREYSGHGTSFALEITLPSKAKCGEQYITAYANFKNFQDVNNSVEIGISLSHKYPGWNVFVNPNPHFKKAAIVTDVPGFFPALGSVVKLTVAFIGGTVSVVAGHPSNKGTKSVGSNAPLPQPIDVNRYRLVITTGDRRGAYFDRMAISMVMIDGKPFTGAGNAWWVPGPDLVNAERHLSYRPSPQGFEAALSNKK